MNKWATVTQLVNGRAREILQNYVNTVLLCHIWWVASCWVTLMDVVNSPCAQGYMLHLNRFSFFMCKHSHTQNVAICSQKNTILISFCCSFSTSAHQRSSKERILRMRYAPSLEPATVEGGGASSSWDQCCCFFGPKVIVLFISNKNLKVGTDHSPVETVTLPVTPLAPWNLRQKRMAWGMAQSVMFDIYQLTSI